MSATRVAPCFRAFAWPTIGPALVLLALLCLLQLMPATARAQALLESPADSGEALEISLLTFGPGEIYYERFGHNAIVVRDYASGTALSYNYGIFDFEDEDFFLNFARGYMRYRIAASPLDEDLAMYREEGRSIVEQRLDMTPAQRSALRDFLVWNARPENAYYRYDYFVANCSTQVRDALDHALSGLIRKQTEGRSRGYTYRLDALRLMAAEPLLMLAIDLGLGPFADRRLDLWQESFVPQVLADALHDVELGDIPDTRPLIQSQVTLFEGRIPEPPALPPNLRWPFLIAGLAFGALLLWLSAWRHVRAARIAFAVLATPFALFCGIGGLILAALWGLTEHVAAWRNENLMLLNPLCLLLVPAWIGAARVNWQPGRLVRIVAGLLVVIAGFALFSKILPWFIQANLHWIALILPIHIALAVAATRKPTPA